MEHIDSYEGKKQGLWDLLHEELAGMNIFFCCIIVIFLKRNRLIAELRQEKE